jgi:4-hydroxy-tetrahydrodipicolinate reductase
MIRVLVSGGAGRMGKNVLRMLEEDARFTVAGKADVSCADGCSAALPETPADVIIDFSFHTVARELTDYAVRHHMPVVIGTTGYTPEEEALVTEAAKTIPVFRTANLSLGVALLKRMAREAAAAFPDADIEIVEAHHDRKADAPSGTALMLADAIRSVRPDAKNVCGRSGLHKREHDEIGIHAIRMGNLAGTHEIFIATDYETITIKHEAHDRALFAKGALEAAAFLVGKTAGLYGMDDLTEEQE